MDSFSISSQSLLGLVSRPAIAPGGGHQTGRLALSAAWITWLGGSPQQQECALAQLVTSTDRLIERGQDAHDDNWAANQRAALHQLLMGLVRTLPPRSALRRAALWHSRMSHKALVAHLQEHGPSPVIDEALRAGCLLLQLPGADVADMTH